MANRTKGSTKPFKLGKSFRSAIRKAWLWSPVRREAMLRSKVRPGYHICDSCGVELHYKLAKVDHLEPFTPIQGFESVQDVPPAINRLFDLNNQQTLCEPCHKVKTLSENASRREYKKSRTKK